MVQYTILAGGFSTFIAHYLFDPTAVPPTLALITQTQTGTNPSWIAPATGNRSVLYAVNEIQPVGALQSFLVSPTGASIGNGSEFGGGVQLTLVDTVSTGGNGPTFTNPLSTGEVSAMNFGSPNASFVSTVPADPVHFVPAAFTDPDASVVSFPVGAGPSNPHMSLEFGDEVFVPDLGADKIWRLARDADGKLTVQGQIDIDAGAGPRHIAIHDNTLFTVHETASTLTAQSIPPAPNGTTFPLLANVSVVPPGAPPNAQFAAAEIILTAGTGAAGEKFPGTLIYVSNRNIAADAAARDVRGDSIAVFEWTGVDTNANTSVNTEPACTRRATNSKKRMLRHAAWHRRQDTPVPSPASSSPLALVTQVFTNLTQIRSMAIGRADDGGDEFLVAGANVEGGVVVYRRVDGGKGLEEVVRNSELENRTSFVFV